MISKAGASEAAAEAASLRADKAAMEQQLEALHMEVHDLQEAAALREEVERQVRDTRCCSICRNFGCDEARCAVFMLALPRVCRARCVPMTYTSCLRMPSMLSAWPPPVVYPSLQACYRRPNFTV